VLAEQPFLSVVARGLSFLSTMESSAALSTPLLAASRCPNVLNFGRALRRYCQRIIDLDAEVSDRAFDLGMSKQKLDGPEIASASVDQGGLCASQ
jgi:hypothetical protein